MEKIYQVLSLILCWRHFSRSIVFNWFCGNTPNFLSLLPPTIYKGLIELFISMGLLYQKWILKSCRFLKLGLDWKGWGWGGVGWGVLNVCKVGCESVVKPQGTLWYYHGCNFWSYFESLEYSLFGFNLLIFLIFLIWFKSLNAKVAIL